MTTSMASRHLILASASASRRAVLRQTHIEAEVVVSGVDESAFNASSPSEIALLLAETKARTVAALPRAADALVVGCDSILDFDGEPWGKPTTTREAVARWRALRGRSATLWTGHCVVDARSGDVCSEAACATVHFSTPTDDEINAYVDTGEPLQVAGAFALDGRAAAFIERIEGHPGTVCGLSVPVLRRLLGDLGVPFTSLWDAPVGANSHPFPARPIRITVYAGSAIGTQAGYLAEAERFAREAAEAGCEVVYGGGAVGLMGAVADAALAAGGSVVGVMPQSLIDAEVAHRGLTTLHVTATMSERKHLMAQLGDCVVALPGGIGTLEELLEVWTLVALGHLSKPVMVLNSTGYWDALLEMTVNMTEEGFLRPVEAQQLIPVSNAEELLKHLDRWSPPPPRWE
ncbi:TIGR00730 family Rossman fold protein [Streptomyces cyaneofuscatus]|uniref:TIGR00730 family Rossman fold protein n=1 Tax=Streptomyces cyaneofuscatus TaxID=66883 RepID=UPI0036682CED